jgi:hypothetical protein
MSSSGAPKEKLSAKRKRPHSDSDAEDDELKCATDARRVYVLTKKDLSTLSHESAPNPFDLNGTTAPPMRLYKVSELRVRISTSVQVNCTQHVIAFINSLARLQLPLTTELSAIVIQALSKQRKEERAYVEAHGKEIYAARKQAEKEARMSEAAAADEAAAAFLVPWQEPAQPKKKRSRSKQAPPSVEATLAAAAAATAVPDTPTVPAKGTSMLPAAVWQHILEFLCAHSEDAIRGATAAATDMATAALVCTDSYASTVQTGWNAIAAGFLMIEQLGDTDDERTAALECLLHNPLKAKLEHIQTALRILRLPVSGKKAALVHRLFEVRLQLSYDTPSHATIMLAHITTYEVHVRY